jgi:hypothetical protein
VWAWDDDVEDAKEWYYVGEETMCNSDFPYHAESDYDSSCFKHISLTDPRKKEEPLTFDENAMRICFKEARLYHTMMGWKHKDFDEFKRDTYAKLTKKE